MKKKTVIAGALTLAMGLSSGAALAAIAAPASNTPSWLGPENGGAVKVTDQPKVLPLLDKNGNVVGYIPNPMIYDLQPGQAPAHSPQEVSLPTPADQDK